MSGRLDNYSVTGSIQMKPSVNNSFGGGFTPNINAEELVGLWLNEGETRLIRVMDVKIVEGGLKLITLEGKEYPINYLEDNRFFKKSADPKQQYKTMGQRNAKFDLSAVERLNSKSKRATSKQPKNVEKHNLDAENKQHAPKEITKVTDYSEINLATTNKSVSNSQNKNSEIIKMENEATPNSPTLVISKEEKMLSDIFEMQKQRQNFQFNLDLPISNEILTFISSMGLADLDLISKILLYNIITHGDLLDMIKTGLSQQLTAFNSENNTQESDEKGGFNELKGE